MSTVACRLGAIDRRKCVKVLFDYLLNVNESRVKSMNLDCYYTRACHSVFETLASAQAHHLSLLTIKSDSCLALSTGKGAPFNKKKD